MAYVKLLWFGFWISSIASGLQPEKAISNLWFRFEDENHVMDSEKPSKVTAKIGANITIPCKMKYNLTFFAWCFCESDCGSPKTQCPNGEWKIVVRVDNGSINIFYPEKFGLDKDGALILKDVHPSNNNNWIRCYYQERLVGMEHRTTVIHIANESPTITLKSVKDHVVFQGMSLLLDCGAKGFPIPWVAWIRNDQVLQNRTDGPTFLLRRRVTLEEAGSYTCIAGNSIGNSSYSYQVTVKSNDYGPTSGSKAPAGKSTAKRSTEGTKVTSEAPPADPTRESKKGTSSNSEIGLGVGIAIAFVAGIAFAVLLAYCCFRRREKRKRPFRAAYEGDLSSASEDGIDEVHM